MFRSMSSRTTNGMNASTDDRQKSISKDSNAHHSSIKKAFSLIFHKIDSPRENCPADTEMHEFIPYMSTSEDNLHTSHRSISNLSHSSISLHFPHSTTVQEKISHWKNKLRYRSEEKDIQHEKNTGYLVVSNPNFDPILVSDNCFDQQATQNAQPCVQINTTAFDLNQIQYSSITPLFPNESTCLIPCHPSYDNREQDELDIQATRSSTECGVPQADFYDMKERQPMSPITSTNSSGNEFTGIDRSLLNDNDYVLAQEIDLHQLIDLEVDLCKELCRLEDDIEDELEFAKDYESALQLNVNLKEELRLLEETNPIYSSWACEFCTYVNEPYIDTNRDVCDMCESPSPVKQAALIK